MSEESSEYVDTSAYEVYEKQEGDFVEGEPVAEEAMPPKRHRCNTAPKAASPDADLWLTASRIDVHRDICESNRVEN